MIFLSNEWYWPKTMENGFTWLVFIRLLPFGNNYCLIQAYSIWDKEVGYCQGSAFIVGILLMQVTINNVVEQYLYWYNLALFCLA